MSYKLGVSIISLKQLSKKSSIKLNLTGETYHKDLPINEVYKLSKFNQTMQFNAI